MGPITLYTYGLLVATGLLLGVALAFRQARKAGYDPQVIMDIVFYVVLAGIIGSRLLYVIQNISLYRDHPLNVVKIWEGGLSFHGALLFGLPVGWMLIRKTGLSFWGLFDVCAPSIAIGQAVGRVGCFFAGCCHGSPTDVPWAVTFHDPNSLAPTGISLHPTQLYTASFLMIVFIVLILVRPHTRFAGQLACLYLILHSLFRFFIEFLRADHRLFLRNLPLSLTQLISILILLTALVSYRILKHNQHLKAVKYGPPAHH